MSAGVRHRLLWLGALVALVATLGWFDRAGNGLADTLHACNLALSRSPDPAADVVVLGSSRTGVSIDHVAMASMLDAAGVAGDRGEGGPSVDRIALARSPIRAQVALLENYLEKPGSPDVIVFEIGFVNPRNVELFDGADSGLAPDRFILRRDLDLMTYRQIWRTPAVGLPYTGSEGRIALWQHRTRGVVRRSGALLSRLLNEPRYRLGLDNCETSDFLRADDWPTDFSYIHGQTDSGAAPAERVAVARADIASESSSRQPEEWQIVDELDAYPYDVAEPYRAGEMALLDRAIELAAERDIPIVLLPMTLFDQRIAADDLDRLNERLGDRGAVFDVYRAAGDDLTTYWYDDAHLEPGPATELVTALLADHLLREGFLDVDPADEQAGDQ